MAEAVRGVVRVVVAVIMGVRGRVGGVVGEGGRLQVVEGQTVVQAGRKAVHAGGAAGGGGGGGDGSHAGLAPRRTCRRGRPARGPTRPGSLAAAPPWPRRPSHGFRRGKFGSGGAQGVSRGKSGQSCSIRHNHRRRSILPRRRPPRRRRRALVHPLPLQIFQKSPPKSLVVRRAYWRSSRSPGEVRGLGQASARLPLLRQATSASPDAPAVSSLAPTPANLSSAWRAPFFYPRKWQAGAHGSYLEQSVFWYDRGYCQ